MILQQRTGAGSARRLRLECLEDRSVPATFMVNTTFDDVTAGNGQLSLREAITKANTHAGADVIVLPAGVFKIAIAGANEDANATGDFDITDTVTIQGAGAGASIVDGQQLDRVFDVLGTAPSSIKAVFQGLTVRNGAVTGDAGGIRVGNADLVVRDSIIAANRASLTGGGISNASAPSAGNVKLVSATVVHNVAGSTGGGVGLFGSSVLTVTDSTIRRNVATGNGGGLRVTTANLTNSAVNGNYSGANGGGLFSGQLTLTSCAINGNFAVLFGGGINADGTATLTSSTVSGNSSGSEGGGISAFETTLTSSTVRGNTAATDGGGIFTASAATLTNSTVSGNTANGRGGGINSITATLTNSTVSGNSAAIEGGGLFATTASLLNCTIVENIADTGGGLFHVAGGTFSVKNTIVALNLVTFGGNGPNAFGASFTSQGHNLVGDGTGSNGFTNGVNGDLVGTAADHIDPKLGPLQNNGGATETHNLLAGSPAIDHGASAGAPATDQRGFPRKKDGNGDGIAKVDIGAFER